jgi:hypothetical protein
MHERIMPRGAVSHSGRRHDRQPWRGTSPLAMMTGRRIGLLGVLLGGGLGATTVLGGCTELTGSPGLPAGTEDPAFYSTAAGAIGMRNAALVQFGQALGQYIIDAGQLTDELESFETGASQGVLLQNAGQVPDPLDERLLPVGVTVESYGQLQLVRTLATQALGALATYDTAAGVRDSVAMLRGELYALEGYTEIMLADLFCSGVPLSDLIFQGDFQYEPSSTTTQVYQDALAKFDSTVVLAGANDSVRYLARVGQGRAYLEWGCPTCYATAADDVSGVPDGFLYQVSVNWNAFLNTNTILGNANAWTMSDREGQNGLPFLSSGDPRSTAVTLNVSGPSWPYVPLTFPAVYGAALTGTSIAPVTLASGVEARLIDAEAALQQGDAPTWLTTLNALRASAPIPGTTQPNPQALPPIVDPQDPVARIDTLFTERAEWLFLTGHRQGDLRRLLRQYSSSSYTAFQTQQQVYPTGAYLAPGTGRYGTDVVAPIPPTESANPDFHGCISNDP